MANEQNLIPINKRGKEEAKIIRQMGQKAQRANQKKRKSMQEILSIIVDKKPSDDIIKKMKELYPSLNNNDINILFVLMNNFVSRLGKDNISISEYMKGLEFLRDSMGEKPIEKSESTNINIENDLSLLSLEQL